MNALLVADLEKDEIAPREGPGRRLRAAREARGIDAVGMAGMLHLSRSVIDAIDADEYARLPASVFVRGYLRNYARMVGEPGEAVLAAYERVRPADGEQRKVRGIALNKTEIRSNHFLVQLMTMLIVLGLVALLAIWWQGYLEQPFNLAGNGPEATAATEAATAEPPQTVATVAATEPSATPNLAATPAQTPAHTETPATLAATQSAPIAPPPAAMPEEEHTSGAVAAEIVPPEGSTIRLAIRDESWVDVRDAKGKIVFAGVLGKGSEKSIQGAGPFQVVLGNAPGVDVSLDGKKVDMGRHTKKNIARFTLDPKKP